MPLARSGIGLAVRAGAPKPDISSALALRQALLKATSVAYSASVSGRYVSTELFQRLGKSRNGSAGKSREIDRERVGAVVARGEAEIGFQQTSELLAVPGIDYVGPLPPEVQRVSVFSAGVSAHSRNADAARALNPVSGVARGCADRVEDRSRADGGRTGPERADIRIGRSATLREALRLVPRPDRPADPSRDALAKTVAGAHPASLDFGPMMSVAYPMKRRSAKPWRLSRQGRDEPAPPPSAMCGPDRRIMAGVDGGWTGWSPTPTTRASNGGSAPASFADMARLELKWALAFPGDVTAFAAPTVKRHALRRQRGRHRAGARREDGCLHWLFQASGPVRAAMTVAATAAAGALFSDQIGGVYAVDARTGRALEDASRGARGDTR